MLGANLKKIRESLNISQRELGRRIGKTGQYISYLENSESSNPSLDVLNKIAEVLDVPLPKLTRISAAEKINKILKDKNISIDEISTKLGDLIEKLPTGEYRLNLSVISVDKMLRIANALEVPFNILIEGTTLEDNYRFNDQKWQSSFSLQDSVVDNEVFIRQQIELRIENRIPISVMSRILDIKESDLKEFECNLTNSSEIVDKYTLVLHDILKVRNMIFNTLLENSNIKKLLSIDEKEQYLLADSLALYLNHQLEFEPKQEMINIDKKLTFLNKGKK